MKSSKRSFLPLLTVAFACFAQPAFAQDDQADPTRSFPTDDETPRVEVEETVFDETWLTVGLGAGLSPSYTGSNDYIVNPLPLLQGRIGPVRINPRAAGVALDVMPKSGTGVDFQFGPAIRIRNDRANRIEDEVVKLAGELDTAVEVGASAGFSLSRVLTPFDTLGFNVDVRWDIAGAHRGMVIEPGVSYITPVSRSTALLLTAGASFGDRDFADYYYSVSPDQADASGLAEFTADGGLNSVGVNALVAIDLDGNIANGGLGAFVIGGYSRLTGEAADTPYTRVRGSKDQFLGGVGLAYTF